jgi:hypothetical protein
MTATLTGAPFLDDVERALAKLERVFSTSTRGNARILTTMAPSLGEAQDGRICTVRRRMCTQVCVPTCHPVD